MKVMLTSVGRRAYMVKYFKEALGTDGEVHVCNSDDLTVAFNYADKAVISPMIYDEGYIPFLINYCKENEIDMIVSLFDIDLLVLSKAKDRFTEVGTKVVVGDEWFVDICNDKWKTFVFLKENGFDTPKTYLRLKDVEEALSKGEAEFPFIVKPRFGMGSIAVATANDMDELRFYAKHNAKEVEHSYLRFESAAASREEWLIFQECIDGQEYGADVINDFSGNVREIVIRKKLAMRSGETDIAEIEENDSIRDAMKKLGEISKHIGNMDVDVFLKDDKVYVLEMNARFGGGYPFSHVAGCNLPLALVKWCTGEEVDDGLLRARPGTRAFKELEMCAKRESVGK